MLRAIRSGTLILSVAMVAACGGGSATPTQGVTPTVATGATAGPAATAAPGAAEAPAATQAPAATGAGVGSATSACELLSVEEAAASLGTAPLTATPGSLGGQTFCDYRTSSGEAVLTSYMQLGAGQMWAVFESSLETDPVSGIGDKAMFEPSTKLLFVLKGDTFFNIFVADPSLDAAAALEKEKALAQLMVANI